MARKLFEFRATRARAGGLAVGIEYVVWDDEAATVLADISTSSGGSSIAGSTVTTADIAGLGPSACRFWGPTDDQDTLWVTCPSDPTLGVQRVEASTDARLDALEAGGGGSVASHSADTTAIHGITDTAQLAVRDAANTFTAHNYFKSGRPWVALRAYGTGTGTSADMQAAINDAQTMVSGDTGAPMILVDPGEYHWTTAVTLKTARIVCLSGFTTGARVLWDGAAGATVMTRDTSTGGASFGGIEGIDFRPGTAEPAVWLDLSTNGVDVGFRLKELHFVGGTECAIKMESIYNLHWEHLRFGGCGSGSGGFAIKMTPAGSSFLSTFVLDGFTYDNNRGGLSGGATGAEGMILVDLSNNPPNLGTFVLKNGRIEANTAWSGRKGLVVAKVPNSGANPRSLGLCVEDVTYQDVVSGAGDVLLYHDTTATNMFPSLVLKNFRQSGLAAIVGGSLSASYPAIPVQPAYGFVAVAQHDNEIMAAAFRALATDFGGAIIYALRRGSQSFDRWQMDDTGKQSFGNGNGATDATFYRLGPGAMKSDGLLIGGTGLGVGNSAAATTPGTVTKKMEVFDASGVSLGFVAIYNAIT